MSAIILRARLRLKFNSLLDEGLDVVFPVIGKYYLIPVLIMKMITFVLVSLIFFSCNGKNKSENLMDVKLYYFDGCPGYIETSKNLKQALNELNLKYNFELVKIKDAEDAQNKRFLGSPTIRINGVDLEKKEDDYIFGCRIYTIDGKITGIPTKKYILSKLNSFIEHKK